MKSRYGRLSIVFLALLCVGQVWSQEKAVYAQFVSGERQASAKSFEDLFILVEDAPGIVQPTDFGDIPGYVSPVGCETCGCGDGCCDCGDACCDCGDACGNGKLFGLFIHSDPCFHDFISPMTNPVFFEDPRTLTEVRAIFLRQDVPSAASGGTVHLFALQARAALTDRLSIIATKDGFITSSNPLIADGWADISAGLKYNLYADPQKQRLLSTGFFYELPVGSPRALQGNGDGEFHIFMSGGMQLGEYSHWVSGTGFRLPSAPAEESRMWYWSNHLDCEFADGWYALTELNWYSWIGSGQNGALNGLEGGDLFNFGSTGVTGNDIVTNAVGIKRKRSNNSEIGVAFEYPLTTRRDVLRNRLTVDWIFRY